MVEIVIKLPDKTYHMINAGYYDYGDMNLIIQNGMILPKGHGRLIDADELYGDFIDGTEGYNCQTWNRIEIGDVIEEAPTIIPADTESEDKE